LLFWNVTFIYNAFIRTTDHCKVETAFANRVVKNYTGSLLPGYIPDGYPGTRGSPALGHLTIFNEFLRIFLISENSLKFANFFCWGNEFSIYDFLHPVFSASRAQYISDLRSKFALRLQHVWKCGRHPICGGWD